MIPTVGTAAEQTLNHQDEEEEDGFCFVFLT